MGVCFSMSIRWPTPSQDADVPSEIPLSRCSWHQCAWRGKREGWGCGLETPTRQFAFPETLPLHSSNPIGWLSHGAKSHKSFMQEFPLVYQQWSSWLPLPLPPNVSKTKKSDLQSKKKKENFIITIIYRVPTTLTNELIFFYDYGLWLWYGLWLDLREKKVFI